MDGRHVKFKLNSASSEGAVVALLEEYLTSWKEDELALLPQGCVPERFANAEDINFWSLKLARARLDFRGSQPAFTLLQDLTNAFGDASARLATIGHWRKLGA